MRIPSQLSRAANHEAQARRNCQSGCPRIIYLDPDIDSKRDEIGKLEDHNLVQKALHIHVRHRDVKCIRSGEGMVVVLPLMSFSLS